MIGCRVDSPAVQVELETAEPPAVAAEDVRVRRGGVEVLRGVSFALGTATGSTAMIQGCELQR
jgi:hypothetical protein